MRSSLLSVVFFTVSCSALTFQTPPRVGRTASSVESVTQLSLFGGKKEGGGDSKGPGMMDQIAMLKKAQEVATKKMSIDKEIAAMDFTGTAADGKVSATVKYCPPAPMQQPSYETAKIELDEGYLESASAEDVGVAVAEALKDGYKMATSKVAEKTMELMTEIQKIMPGAGGAAPAAAE